MVQPSSHQLRSVTGAVEGEELSFTISQENSSKESIKAALDKQVALYETELAQLSKDLQHFNARMASYSSGLVEAR